MKFLKSFSDWIENNSIRENIVAANSYIQKKEADRLGADPDERRFKIKMTQPLTKPAPTKTPVRKPMTPSRPSPIPTKQPFKAPEPAKADAEDVLKRLKYLTDEEL